MKCTPVIQLRHHNQHHQPTQTTPNQTPTPTGNKLMPRAPKHCKHPGCHNRVTPPTKYCPTHMNTNWANPHQRRPDINTKQHRQWRKAVLQRDQHKCQLNYSGCTHTATEADHIKPISQGGTTTLTNGQAVCHNCHTKKTRKEAKQAQKHHTTTKNTPKPPPTTPHPAHRKTRAVRLF